MSRSFINREYALSQMAAATSKIGLVCYDEEWAYYEVGVAGYFLMYRQRLHTQGRRCYLLTEELAKCLNFNSFADMRWFVPTLQYWRGWVSVERLRVALAKYDDKWGDIIKDIG